MKVLGQPSAQDRSAVLVNPALLRERICLLTDFPGQPFPRLLSRPQQIVTTTDPDKVPALLKQVELMAQAGGWVGGFLSYEAGAAFQLAVNRLSTQPLLWFARFEQAEPTLFPHPNQLPRLGDCSLSPLISQKRYEADLEKILQYILAGDSYQVNHTLSARLPASLDLASLFLKIQPQHRFPYAAWLNTGESQFASFSPELLIAKKGDRLLTAPIKGTRPRSLDIQEDNDRRSALLRSEKDRAEHIMIVDMARNDLGKVCQVGSIHVPQLMICRPFSTVHHLESRIEGRVMPGVGLEGVMSALFPAASITGAPKNRTMEIIRELEGRERGIYTGSIGVIEPGGDYRFNVAIRTVSQTTPQDPPHIGLGGGIVADSIPVREWREIGDKGAFISQIPEPFGLIETFLLGKEGSVPALSDHLTRLADSAYRLGFLYEAKGVTKRVTAESERRAKKGETPCIMRLELSMDGRLNMSYRPFTPAPQRLRINIAPFRVDQFDPLLQHKTNRRSHLDFFLEKAKAEGFDDVLFLNQSGLITESAIRAILMGRDGGWFVPPLSDGLLPSIWRAKEIVRLKATEKSLPLEQLQGAETLYLGNAVHGGREVGEVWLEGEKIYER